MAAELWTTVAPEVSPAAAPRRAAPRRTPELHVPEGDTWSLLIGCCLLATRYRWLRCEPAFTPPAAPHFFCTLSVGAGPKPQEALIHELAKLVTTLRIQISMPPTSPTKHAAWLARSWRTAVHSIAQALAVISAPLLEDGLYDVVATFAAAKLSGQPLPVENPRHSECAACIRLCDAKLLVLSGLALADAASSYRLLASRHTVDAGPWHHLLHKNTDDPTCALLIKFTNRNKESTTLGRFSLAQLSEAGYFENEVMRHGFPSFLGSNPQVLRTEPLQVSPNPQACLQRCHSRAPQLTPPFRAISSSITHHASL